MIAGSVLAGQVGLAAHGLEFSTLSRLSSKIGAACPAAATGNLALKIPGLVLALQKKRIAH